jgi:hypothetical protein
MSALLFVWFTHALAAAAGAASGAVGVGVPTAILFANWVSKHTAQLTAFRVEFQELVDRVNASLGQPKRTL